ncbi:V/A-type H+-transporting ATPase subunit E [Ignavigranum ruoffiae]|uniref:V/A-type H+-transporting ATPase subunit E n=1 Tax=Ignavigranum ruoffiae TaxID=89093 RepID=A0A1H8YXY4_9LACT|nr:hypothetical protein [Ignavigranum ruoffiae]UPQ85408.1 hypothetical protein M0R79_07070 [Ignavigranum ruoffiae]SEP56946.1 V/A-type H+-transporting ATPase subunit E [Ignavigranum ruoffiae]
MDEFDKLKRSVIEQAEQKGKEYYQREVRKLEQSYKEKFNDLNRSYEENRQQALAKVRHHHDRLIQQIQNKERQTSLVSKQEILTSLFEETVHKMTQWTVEDETRFIQRILNKYQGQPLTLLLGQKTLAKFSQRDLDQLQKEFPNIQISQESISGQAGFKLVMNQIDYNYLYADLVKDSQREISSDIAQRIFVESDAE